MVREVCTSVRAYCWSLGIVGWIMYLCGIGSLITFAQSAFEVPHIPRVVWLVGAVVLLIVGPFWAFHKVRLERDDEKRRNDTVRQLREARAIVRDLAQGAYRLSLQLELSQGACDRWAQTATKKLAQLCGEPATSTFWLSVDGLPHPDDTMTCMKWARRVSEVLFEMSDKLDASDIQDRALLDGVK